MGIVQRAMARRTMMGRFCERSTDVQVGLKNCLHDVAFDELALSAGAESNGVVSDAVDVAERPGGGLVQDGDGVGGEEFLRGSRRDQASPNS